MREAALHAAPAPETPSCRLQRITSSRVSNIDGTPVCIGVTGSTSPRNQGDQDPDPPCRKSVSYLVLWQLQVNDWMRRTGAGPTPAALHRKRLRRWQPFPGLLRCRASSCRSPNVPPAARWRSPVPPGLWPASCGTRGAGGCASRPLHLACLQRHETVSICRVFPQMAPTKVGARRKSQHQVRNVRNITPGKTHQGLEKFNSWHQHSGTSPSALHSLDSCCSASTHCGAPATMASYRRIASASVQFGSALLPPTSTPPLLVGAPEHRAAAPAAASAHSASCGSACTVEVEFTDHAVSAG